MYIWNTYVSEMLFHFTNPLENKDVIAQETVTLSCELSEPGLPVTWLKNNVPLSISEGRHEIISRDYTYSLVIPYVSKQDAGQYTVRIGEIQCTSQLAVHGE